MANITLMFLPFKIHRLNHLNLPQLTHVYIRETLHLDFSRMKYKDILSISLLFVILRVKSSAGRINLKF